MNVYMFKCTLQWQKVKITSQKQKFLTATYRLKNYKH